MLNWKRRFITIAIGQTISLVGSSAVQFAIIWWITQETGSAIMLGLSGLTAYIPIILLSPFAGVLADRISRKRICIYADMFMGIAAAVFALLMWSFELPIWSALIVLLIRGIGGTFHQPSLQAIIPQLVPANELVRANGWSQFMQSGAFMLGPVLGAAMFAALPLPVILMTDLVGALIASVMLGIVPVPKLERKQSDSKTHFFAEFREGVQVFLEDRRLLTLIISATLCMIFFLPVASFYPLMTSDYFQGTAWHASAVELSFAIGMMIAAILFGSIVRIKNKIRMSFLGMMGIGIASTLCGILPPSMWGFWIFLFLCGGMGAAENAFNIPMMAYLQETIEPEKMGRAFSVISIVTSLTMPVGLIIGGPVAEKIGVNMWFMITGVICIMITSGGILAERKTARKRT